MKEVVVTTSWDDGHVLDFRLSTILMKYGMRGTFYISPEDRQIPPDKRLTKEQIQTIAENFEIGAHTMTHPDLRLLDTAQARSELVQSKYVLEQVTQKPVTSFCYPSGHFSERDVQLVRDAGFTLARTVERFETAPATDPYRLKTTIHAYNHWSDALQIARFARYNPITFFRYFRHWDVLAKALFDHTLARGGVFHLWGHSWEVDAHGDWQKLEAVLAYIANRSGVSYRTNAQLL